MAGTFELRQKPLVSLSFCAAWLLSGPRLASVWVGSGLAPGTQQVHGSRARITWVWEAFIHLDCIWNPLSPGLPPHIPGLVKELVKGFKEKHDSVSGKTDPLDTRTVLTAVWFWEERSHRLMPSGPHDADEQTDTEWEKLINSMSGKQ